MKEKKIFCCREILLWDPDFTKVTAEEAERIEKAEKSGFVSEDEIDWDKIGVGTPRKENIYERKRNCVEFAGKCPFV